MKREHRIPLTDQTIAILERIHPISYSSLCASPSGLLTLRL